MAEGRARRGHSDGAYLQARAGNSNRFQDSWRSPTVAYKPRSRCLKPVQGALRTLQQELQLQLQQELQLQSDEADSDSEDEEEVSSRQAAADMETTFGVELGSEPVQLYAIPPKGRRAALVPASDFQQHVDSAKQELAATADAVVRDLHSRFLPPEHVKGLALVSAAANPAKETTKLWRYLAGQPITKADILEYIKLAELALVMTPGSVEEERMFSAMAYLKDDTRNRLQECHLNVCARAFSSNQFDLDTFPDERAISKLLDNAAVRGRYRL
ncbi:hypothetical protein QJQ45_006533 [Haematococcus lacustris]|nr:hypothetical protein QJQ45_006533 [Haematococcus lacustris]